MSRLIITVVKPEVEYKEDVIERHISTGVWYTEVVSKRFEGTITLEFQSSGDLTGYTKEDIRRIIIERLLTDHISL